MENETEAVVQELNKICAKNFSVDTGYCAYPDEESALDFSLVESMDVNSKNPLISTHDYAKYLVIMVDTLTKVEL